MKYAATKKIPNTTTAVTTAIIAAFVLAGQAAAQQQTSAVGRYQLVAGSIGSGENQHPTVIKIDTATGETWELIVVQLPGKSPRGTLDGWAKLPNDIVTDYKKMLDALKP